MPDVVRHSNLTDEVSEAGDLLEMIIRGRPSWQRDALCREHPELSWFLTPGQDPLPARRICDACLVHYECKRWALEQGPELQGMWAGTSPKDRRQIRAGRAA